MRRYAYTAKFGSTFFVTIALAPVITLSPIVEPGVIMAFQPMFTLLPTFILPNTSIFSSFLILISVP